MKILGFRAPHITAGLELTAEYAGADRGESEQSLHSLMADAAGEGSMAESSAGVMRVLDHSETGKVVSNNWHDYKLPTTLDVPREIVSVPIEPDDAEAYSTGTKGLGEPVTIPTAVAIANAVYNATGIRVTNTPISPLQLSRLLAERKAKR